MIKSAIVGASGYSGAEVFRILSGHPNVELTAITSTSRQGSSISELYQNITSAADMVFSSYSATLAAENDVIFLALPHGQAMEIVPDLMAAGDAKIIDLSGDFRLPGSVYESWYKKPHSSPSIIDSAVYGLSELNHGALLKARLVANPGCYPTSIILAIAPLSLAKVISEPIVATCLSGISGAGRAATDLTHYCRAESNVSSYKVGGTHQHIPEIEQWLSGLAQETLKIVFTPQLGPFTRGIYSNVAAPLKKETSLKEIDELYRAFYNDKPFVKVLDQGVFPELKGVSGTNYCHVGVTIDKRTNTVIAISAIDNLVKGAAGQAIQNMNIIFGLDETTGLTTMGSMP